MDGKRIGPLSTKTKDRKKAQLRLDKILGKRSRGEIISTSREKGTIADILHDYLTYADERLRSAKIIRYVVEANLLPRLGELRLAQCDVHRLRKYRQERRKEGNDDTTCNRELSYPRAAWRRALKEGHVQHIP